MSLSINSNLYNPCNPNDYKGVSKSNDVNYCAGEKSTKDLNAASGFSGGERLGVTTFGNRIYIATYAKDSTADDPIVKVGNHQVRINDVDPKNATELEMFALMSYMDKNGMTNNRGISSYTKMKAFSGQAEYNGFCEGIYDSETGITEKYDWISILNNAKETFLNIAQTYSQAVEIDRMIFTLNEKTIWNT